MRILLILWALLALSFCILDRSYYDSLGNYSLSQNCL